MAVDPKALVERFYFEVWNQADESAAREILADDFGFRGSLGPGDSGVDGFIDYMRAVHGCLGNYRCEIEELIIAGNKAAARMRFSGIHKGTFYGVPPTKRKIAWIGAAFFTCSADRIVDLWVLGDVDGLKHRLGASDDTPFG